MFTDIGAFDFSSINIPGRNRSGRNSISGTSGAPSASGQNVDVTGENSQKSGNGGEEDELGLGAAGGMGFGGLAF